MAEAPKTLEGWYCLHDIRRIDWARWRALPETERNAALDEVTEFVSRIINGETGEEGAATWAALAGHKGDLLLMLLRPELEDLVRLEHQFNQLAFAGFTERTDSFVSVTELSQYVAGAKATTTKAEERTPEQQAFLERRLKPQLPGMRYMSFYPMDKRRGETANWYTLPLEERARMMRSHGHIGMQYKGQVQQIVTGSIGFDDWEWGVTLFADDALPLKKIVTEMRYDEASSVYGLFGRFYVGVQGRAEDLRPYLLGQWPAQEG